MRRAVSAPHHCGCRARGTVKPPADSAWPGDGATMSGCPSAGRWQPGYGPLAQLAEQRTFNPSVVGSSPTGPTVHLGWDARRLRNRSPEPAGSRCDGLPGIAPALPLRCRWSWCWTWLWPAGRTSWRGRRGGSTERSRRDSCSRPTRGLSPRRSRRYERPRDQRRRALAMSSRACPRAGRPSGSSRPTPRHAQNMAGFLTLKRQETSR